METTKLADTVWVFKIGWIDYERPSFHTLTPTHNNIPFGTLTDNRRSLNRHSPTVLDLKLAMKYHL